MLTTRADRDATGPGPFALTFVPPYGGADERVVLAQDDHVLDAAAAPAGDAAAVVWVRLEAGEPALALATATRAGVVLAPRTIVTPYDGIDHPGVAFDGDAFGVVWQAPRGDVGTHRVYFLRVAADGTVDQPPQALSEPATAADAPTIAASGRGWGVVWHARNCYPAWCANFVAIDAAGRPRGAPVRISDPP